LSSSNPAVHSAMPSFATTQRVQSHHCSMRCWSWIRTMSPLLDLWKDCNWQLFGSYLRGSHSWRGCVPEFINSRGNWKRNLLMESTRPARKSIRHKSWRQTEHKNYPNKFVLVPLQSLDLAFVIFVQSNVKVCRGSKRGLYYVNNIK
jgi:hypothetical protein